MQGSVLEDSPLSSHVVISAVDSRRERWRGAVLHAGTDTHRVHILLLDVTMDGCYLRHTNELGVLTSLE